MKVASSCMTLCDPVDQSPWDSPGKNTGVGSLSLLQGIFPTQGSDPGLPHGRRILYQLRHQGGLEELLNNEIFHSSLQIMSFLGLRVFKAVCTDILCVHI